MGSFLGTEDTEDEQIADRHSFGPVITKEKKVADRRSFGPVTTSVKDEFDEPSPNTPQENIPEFAAMGSAFKNSQITLLANMHMDSSEDFNSDSELGSTSEEEIDSEEVEEKSEALGLFRDISEKYVELRHAVVENSSHLLRGMSSSIMSQQFSMSNRTMSAKSDSVFTPIPPDNLKTIDEYPPVWECNNVLESKFKNHGKHRVSINQYLLEKRLGKGSFGHTWRAIDLISQITYAVKMLDKASLKRTRVFFSPGKPPTNEYEMTVKNEIAIMKAMWHPNVVNLNEIVQDSEHPMLYLVLEFVPGGQVCALEGEPDPSCDPLEINVALSYLRGILTGLDYLHSNQVFHSDLKPDNILLTDLGEVKISDFGTSRIMEGDHACEHRGTLAFSAPEIEEEQFLWRPCDIWAVGVIFYVFLFGKLPFNGGISEMMEQIQQEQIKILKDDLPAEAIDLLHLMLKKQPSERITMQKLKEHPFLTQGDFRFLDTHGEQFGSRKLEERKFSPEELKDQVEDVTSLLTKYQSSANLHEKS